MREAGRRKRPFDTAAPGGAYTRRHSRHAFASYGTWTSHLLKFAARRMSRALGVDNDRIKRRHANGDNDFAAPGPRGGKPSTRTRSAVRRAAATPVKQLVRMGCEVALTEHASRSHGHGTRLRRWILAISTSG